MIFIFDLDYTLLDAALFKKKLARALGLSFKDFYKTYNQFFKDKNICFHPDKHINGLIKQDKIKAADKADIKKNITELLNNIDNFIFPHAEEILKKLNNNHNLILLSYGNPTWQKIKIKNLRIKKYFYKIIITDRSKEASLGFLKSNTDKKIIINDNARESFAIKKILGQAKIFLVLGPYTYNIEHKLKIYNLKDLPALLAKF